MSGESYNRYRDIGTNPWDPSNAHSYGSHDRASAFGAASNAQLSLEREPSIEYDKVEHFLVVSSRSRDHTVYPGTSHYRLSLPKEYKNVHSIELVQAIIPDKNNVALEPYLLLKIDEVGDVMESPDENISEAFAFLSPSGPVQEGGFICLDKRVHENTPKVYLNPKASLDKMTIRLTDWNGAVFDFGSDSPPYDKSLQTTYVFKICCLEKKRAALNTRGVF